MSRTYLADEVETLDLSPIEKVTQTSMLHSVATIDTEIATLSQKARKYTLKNEQLWNLIGVGLDAKPPRFDFKEQIDNILTQLTLHERLLLFKNGFADKTGDMLSRTMHNVNQLFYTFVGPYPFKIVCMACLTAQVDRKHQIVVCSSCGYCTHTLCLGLKPSKVYRQWHCDSCIPNLQFPQTTDPQGLVCEICFLRHFAMKNIEGHYFHISCLFLFNLVDTKSFAITLKEQLNIDSLLYIVRDGIETKECAYCRKEKGMKFQCSFENCETNFHSLCGYIYGCNINIRRQGYTLSVKAFCLIHSYSSVRDYQEQLQLRRIFLNFFEDVSKYETVGPVFCGRVEQQMLLNLPSCNFSQYQSKLVDVVKQTTHVSIYSSNKATDSPNKATDSPNEATFVQEISSSSTSFSSSSQDSSSSEDSSCFEESSCSLSSDTSSSV